MIARTAPAAASEREPASEARLAANRANAQLSTGPKTEAGKAKSALNAVSTGLTGRTVLLQSDDAVRYQQHVDAFFDDLEPVGARETALVQSLADNAWRQERTTALEMSIYAHGRVQFAELFAHEDSAVQPGLIEMHTFLTYERQLRNLQTHEARLRRQREKDTAELRQLQTDRHRQEKRDLEVAAKLYMAARHDNQPFNPADHGFEFSIEDICGYLDGVRAAVLTRQAMHASEEPDYRPRQAA